MLFVVCWLQVFVCCLLCVVCCVRCAVCCRLVCVVCWLLFVVCCLLIVVCCLWFLLYISFVARMSPSLRRAVHGFIASPLSNHHWLASLARGCADRKRKLPRCVCLLILYHSFLYDQKVHHLVSCAERFIVIIEAIRPLTCLVPCFLFLLSCLLFGVYWWLFGVCCMLFVLSAFLRLVFGV